MTEDAGVIGFSIGAGRLVATAINPSDPRKAKYASTAFLSGSPEDFIAQALELLQQLEITKDRVESVGAAIPGQIDWQSGIVTYCPNFANDAESWVEVPIGEMLEETFEAPAFIDNDANSLVVYQRALGSGRGHRSFVVVYLAPDLSGLGSGIMVDDRVLRGCSGGAGEFGHVVVQPDGPRCSCGNRGCLQALVGAETFIRNVNWGGRDHPAESIAAAALLAEKDDERAKSAFLRAGRFFGQGMSVLVNLLNPPLIFLGGPDELVAATTEPRSWHRRRANGNRSRVTSARSARLFETGYREKFDAYSFAKLEKDCEIVVVPLNIEMAAVGAAVTAIRGHDTPVADWDEAPLPATR